MINLHFDTNKNSFVTMLMVSSGQRTKGKVPELTCRLKVLCILNDPFHPSNKCCYLEFTTLFLVIQDHATFQPQLILLAICWSAAEPIFVCGLTILGIINMMQILCGAMCTTYLISGWTQGFQVFSRFFRLKLQFHFCISCVCALFWPHVCVCIISSFI